MQDIGPRKTSGFPARLHVLVARDAPVALVIRRGPANHVATFAWNRQTDAMLLGQWLKGRVYERRADLSPDGKHWIYFAMNGNWSGEARGAWTAIARAPWLKAETLLAKGDCWQGGGLFLDNRRYWVNGGACHEPIHEAGNVRQEPAYTPAAWYGGECLTVYYNRLQRDGWTQTSLQSRSQPNLLTVFERHVPRGWTLQKICHASASEKRPRGTGVYWDEHTMVSDEGKVLAFPEWAWADWVDGHLVYAEAGSLYRRSIRNARELGPAHLIHDFNAYIFEARSAPY